MYLPFRALQQFFLKKASLGVAKRLAIPVPKFPIAPVRKKLGSMQAFQFFLFWSNRSAQCWELTLCFVATLSPEDNRSI